jgi:prepilin-type N-terminal cleavage/methylation domain-containing protein
VPRTRVRTRTAVRTRTRVRTLARTPVSNLRANDRGFTLIESVVAAAVVLTTLAGLLYLFLQGAETAARGRRAPIALAAASSKVDQLLALTWTYDPSGAPLSDLSSDTSRDPPAPSGGTGLSLSPSESLARASPGFVDYTNDAGRSLGPTLVAGAIFSRRWSIQPVASSAADALRLEVCVVRIAGTAVDPPPEVCLGTARVRR